MADAQQRTELATRIEQRRQELGARADVSQRLRDLSASGSHFPAPLARRKHRSTLTTLIITASAGLGLIVVAVIATVVIASGVWMQAQINSPSTPVEDFYSAIHQQNYQVAYNKLTTDAQSQMSEPKFEQQMRASDLLSGGVLSYAITSTEVSGSTATVIVEVVRSGDTTSAQVFKVTLVQQQGTWRIGSIAPKGQIAAPTPSN